MERTAAADGRTPRLGALLSLGVDASPVVQMPCAFARVKMFLARVISSEFSVWTEMRMFPDLILPSYRLASISGMPRPINPPAMPPTVAPMAAPLNAAIIGPAAMNGPTPE